MQPDALDRARELADAIVAPGSSASDEAVDLAVALIEALEGHEAVPVAGTLQPAALAAVWIGEPNYPLTARCQSCGQPIMCRTRQDDWRHLR